MRRWQVLAGLGSTVLFAAQPCAKAQAARLGFQLPTSVIARADRVIG